MPAKPRLWVPKVMVAFVLMLACLGFVLLRLNERKYLRFKHQSAKGHADFALACDFLLTHHPLGTNKFIELSGTDPGLPVLVRNLHPEKIKLAANRLWILVDGSHDDGLVIVWEPKAEGQTNIWHLIVGTGEGGTESVYDRDEGVHPWPRAKPPDQPP
jgi:hypothetical protein